MRKQKADKMGSRYFQRPENAISKADEFIKVGELSFCQNVDWLFLSKKSICGNWSYQALVRLLLA